MDAKDIALFVLAAYGALSLVLDGLAVLTWWYQRYPDD
jgi:hypothetical protein